jgi:adenylate cyclase
VSAPEDPEDRWRAVLRALGVTEAELAAVDSREELLLLVIERGLAGPPPRYTEEEAAALAGLDLEETRHLFRALGVPDPQPDEPMLNDDDVEALRRVAALKDAGMFSQTVLLQLSRVLGSSMSRVAESQVSAAVDRVRHGGPLYGPEIGGLRDFPQMLETVWRRQMRAAARRRMGLHESEMPSVAVGFADLVGFTALSQQLDDTELGVLVDRFEATAYDIVGSRGGRVVKMIGDEVMFSVDSVGTAVEIALDLSETYHDDESLSDVRVGLAYGPALDREGDLYGPTVNLASRIVNVAYAGSVVVSDDVHSELSGDDSLVWRSLRMRRLRDIGRVALWTVRRQSDGFEREGPLERARRRRGVMRDAVAGLIPDSGS